MRRSLHGRGQGPVLYTCSKSKKAQPVRLSRGDHLACVMPSSTQQARDTTAIGRLCLSPISIGQFVGFSEMVWETEEGGSDPRCC